MVLALALASHLAVAQAAEPAEARVPSLESAEPLEGGSVASAWAGWSAFGLAYAQGVSERDDLGGYADFDWATTELRLDAFWRRPLGKAGGGGWSAGLRVGLGWYANFGGHWVDGGNEGDRGIDLAPSAIASHPLAGGVLAVSAELPFTFTFWRGGGVIFRPRATVGYETPLWRDLSLGARAGVGWRAGAGGAPLPEGRGEIRFLALATYRVF
jgi:hypothetical protein